MDRKVHASRVFRAAVHSAGHLVVGWKLGLPLAKFSFFIEGGIDGDVGDEISLGLFSGLKPFLFDREKLVAFKAAGYAAENAVFGHFEAVSGHDNNMARDINQAVAEVLPLVRENLDQVLDLARWLAKTVGHSSGHYVWSVKELVGGG